MTYTFNEHKHRYAVWTAARAAQRSFTNTTNICKAINASSLRSFAESRDSIGQTHFDIMHDQWCNTIMSSFPENVVCSYGRAAKIIAIYLKTALILPDHGISPNSCLIHPPIDYILLKAISMKTGLKELGKKTWTKFTRTEYLEVVNILRDQLGRFDWTLEEHWTPEQEDAESQSM